MNANPLRWLTPLALLITIALAINVRNATHDTSPVLELRQQVGLPRGLEKLGLALQLSRSQHDFDLIFSDPDPSKREVLRQDLLHERNATHKDYYLILGYVTLLVLLGMRTWIPKAPHPTWLRCTLVLLPLLAGLFDVFENRGLIAALESYHKSEKIPVSFTFAAWSWMKWVTLFLNFILLGWSQLRVGDKPLVGSFLREASGLLLCLAGGIGLLAVKWPSYIPPAMEIAGLALLLMGLMLFYPDTWWRRRCRLADLCWKQPKAGKF